MSQLNLSAAGAASLFEWKNLASSPADEPVLSRFEFWPGLLFYFPYAAYWATLALRFGAPTLPTLANPNILGGGLWGESKADILDQLGYPAKDYLARYSVLRATNNENGAARTTRALQAIEAAGLAFPLVAKPDIGCRGIGVKKLDQEIDLNDYLARYPSSADCLLQEFIAAENEAGVFYMRRPSEVSGTIFSLTLKFFPSVYGDGSSTLRGLIDRHPRAGKVPQLYLPRFADRLNTVPAKGERIPLVFTGNHCQGAVFRDGASLITPQLTAKIDTIAKSLPEFYFGRIDLRFGSIERFVAGEDFKILEINGAGSEATHIWDSRTKLNNAYRTLFQQIRYAFEIGAANRKAGYKPLSFRKTAMLLIRQERLMTRYRDSGL